MSKKRKNARPHYAWVIVLACVLTQFGTMGAILYPMGLFYAPVHKAFGVGYGTFALTQAAIGLMQGLFMPLAAKSYSRFSMRRVIVISAVLMGASWAILPAFRSFWPWIVSCLFTGIFLAFNSMLHLPILINNWFAKHSGLALAIAQGSGAVSGAVMVKWLVPALIQRWSWQTALIILGIGALICVAFPALFMIRETPAEMGLLPYGAETEPDVEAAQVQTETAIVTTAESRLSDEKTGLQDGRLVLVMIACSLLAGASVYGLHLVPAAQNFGYPQELGATLSSLAMLGTLCTQMVVGPLKDLFGARPVMSVGTVALALIMLAMALFNQDKTILLIGAFMVGLGPTLCNFSIAWLTRLVFGARDYARLVSLATLANIVSMGLFTSLIGYVADWSGSYRFSFLLSAVLAAAAAYSIHRATHGHRDARGSAV